MKDHYLRIKNEFGDKEFKVTDMCKLLKVKERAAYYILNELEEGSKIVKMMRGVYKLSSPKRLRPSKEINEIRNHLLKRITRRFRFTGLSILEMFVHHVPFVLFYHLYVEPGSAEDFKKELEDTSKMVVLVDPKSEHLRNLLAHVNAKKIIIIRELSYFYAADNGLSSPEEAFIDLYFEVTRERIPFMEMDLAEIFKSLAAINILNYSKLLWYAKERKLKDEIETFLRRLASDVHIPAGAL